MKKLFLLSAVLLGAASVCQAGVRFSFGLPLPPLPVPGIIVSQPAPPVYYQAPPPVCYNPPVAYSARVVVAPPTFYFGFGPRYGYHGYNHFYSRYNHCYPGHYGRGHW